MIKKAAFSFIKSIGFQLCCEYIYMRYFCVHLIRRDFVCYGVSKIEIKKKEKSKQNTLVSFDPIHY